MAVSEQQVIEENIERYVLIKDNVCLGVILWDGDTSKWAAPEGVEVRKQKENEYVNSNDIWDGEKWNTSQIELPLE